MVQVPERRPSIAEAAAIEAIVTLEDWQELRLIVRVRPFRANTIILFG